MTLETQLTTSEYE